MGGRKVLESRCALDAERIKKLEQQLQEAQMIAEDSDKKYDQVSQKLSALEVESERADDRLSDDQARIMELTEEYKVVADNMKCLEASEAVALAKEESFEEIILSHPKTQGCRNPRFRGRKDDVTTGERYGTCGEGIVSLDGQTRRHLSRTRDH